VKWTVNHQQYLQQDKELVTIKRKFLMIQNKASRGTGLLRAEQECWNVKS